MTVFFARPRIGITIKLFALFASIGLIPIIFMSFYTFWQINRQVALEVENNLTEMGLRLRDDTGRTLSDMVKSVIPLADDPTFKHPEVSPKEIQKKMMEIRGDSPKILGLFIMKGGQLLVKGGETGFFKTDIDFFALFGSTPHITSPYLFSGIEKPAVLISVPISINPAAKEGPIHLLAAVDVSGLQDLTALVRIGETGRAYIVDDSGRMIAGPDKTPLFTPFADEMVLKRIANIGEGIIHYTDDKGKSFIAFVASIPPIENTGPQGLKVVVSYREDEAYLIADQVRQSLGLAILIILAATSLVSVVLSGAITGPIKEMIRGTERVRAGNFSKEITVKSRDELGELASSFNRMAMELAMSREFMENYNRELERQVKERSRKLEESERRYRMVVEGSGDAWTILDGTLAVRFANGRMGELTGVDPGSLIGRSFLDFFPDPGGERIRRKVTDLFNDRISSANLECEMRGEGERKIVLAATLSVIRGDGRERQVIVHLVDKSELVELIAETQRLHLELMERAKHSQIGIMTEGLFHNLNNPLQALLGILKVLNQDIDRELTDGGKISRDSLDNVRRGILNDGAEAISVTRRLTDQVKNLLLKIRNESQRKVDDLDINDIIRTEVAFLEADLFFKHKITKALVLLDDLPKLPGVYSDLSQSFVNIILNAIDAMRDVSDRRLTITTATEKKKIVVSFHDTGTGIPESMTSRIFDPFFTTKGGSEGGTGLGLFTVEFLLKPYRVTYRIGSNPGDTTFSVLFPATGLRKRPRGNTGAGKRRKKDV